MVRGHRWWPALVLREAPPHLAPQGCQLCQFFGGLPKSQWYQFLDKVKTQDWEGGVSKGHHLGGGESFRRAYVEACAFRRGAGACLAAWCSFCLSVFTTT